MARKRARPYVVRDIRSSIWLPLSEVSLYARASRRGTRRRGTLASRELVDPYTRGQGCFADSAWAPDASKCPSRLNICPRCIGHLPPQTNAWDRKRAICATYRQQ
jgi:hypothetical protein